MNKAGIILIGLTLFCSCRKSSENRLETLTSGFIRVACNEEFENLMDAEINAFCGRYDSAYVIPTYRTEKETMRLFVEDSVRFALSTRGLTDWERNEMDKKNLRARKSLIAFDGVALITSRENPNSFISVSDLKKILTGEITNWTQINPINQSGVIRVLFDNQHSGVFRYLVDSLLQKNTEKVSSNLFELGTAANVIEKTSELPNALGCISGNLVSDEHKTGYSDIMQKIRLMKVSREEKATDENSYLPYAGDIKSENYPLWRSVYILISDPKSGLASGFGVFLANQIGQIIIQTAGLLPVTESNNFYVEFTDEIPLNNNTNNIKN